MTYLSHPVWVRGLKLILGLNERPQDAVAPRVGAWIETSISSTIQYQEKVAPRVGAWIETVQSLCA